MITLEQLTEMLKMQELFPLDFLRRHQDFSLHLLHDPVSGILDKGLGKNKIHRDNAGFLFVFKARRWFHTGCM